MTIIKKISLILILLVMSSTYVHANEQSSNSGQKLESIKKHNLLLAVSVDSVLHKMKQKRKILIIDVRSLQEYDQVHIPGSMNIALYAIKTKSFLKTTPLVLVNNGYIFGILEDECIKLKEKGFNVSILWGGLNAWKEKGLDFEGDVFAVKELNRVSSRDFFHEKEFEEIIILDVSSKEIPESNQPSFDVKHLSDLTEKSLHNALNEADPGKFYSVLIFNENGQGYDKVEKMIKNAGIKNIFYLSGGVNGYRRFINDLSLLRVPHSDRVKVGDKCSP